MDGYLLEQWKQQRRNSTDTGATGEVAKAAVREIDKQRKAIQDEIARRGKL